MYPTSLKRINKSKSCFFTCLLLAFFICLITLFDAVGQPSKVKETYAEGEGYFKDEDYKEALFYFLQVIAKGYNNANVQFKIGVCYLNLPNEEYKSIPYFEKAIKKTSLKYKTNSISEDNAPLYAFFYLGNAYRIDNQLDKALKNYYEFRESEYAYNIEMLEDEISACERAKVILDKPVEVIWEKMPESVNTSNADVRPVISGDENVFIYLTSLKFYNAIYYTRKVQGQWLPTENINPQVLSDGDFYPTALSYDGKELFLVKQTPSNTDLYVSYFKDLKWTPAVPLNENINSTNDESTAAVSSDGRYLYFSSNRKGGKGGFDIYRSERNVKGEWEHAENLGKAINTKDDEVSPSISENGKLLYFSSKGHYNMGGLDIFYSESGSDGKWQVPVNIGYPVNTTSDNFDFKVVGNGKVGYISKQMEKGSGSQDIYKIEIKSKFQANTQEKNK